MKKKIKKQIEICNNNDKKLLLSDVISSFESLGEDDGDGSYCCGKRMVLASSGIAYECLNCGAWEYSSS